MSRSFDPKQLQAIVGDRSLLAQTVERLMSHGDCAQAVVICNGAYADQVSHDLDAAGAPASAVIEEPTGRDTAAAAAVAALWARDAHGEDSVVLLLPSDHYIKNIPALHQTVTCAARAAQAGRIATIGLKPTRPETGYGYIRRQENKLDGLEAYPIAEFAEKPPLETAIEYVESGEYLWNSGMFAFTPSVFLREMQIHCPDILAASEQAYAAASSSAATPTARVELPADLFAAIPKNSIDFAVMEHTKAGAVVEADIGWSDIGSWKSVHECLAADENGNASEGDVVLTEVSNSLVMARSGRSVALAGVKDVIVVDTPDALLVCASDASQSVKAIHAEFQGRNAACASLHGPETVAFEGYMRRWARGWLFDKVLPFWAEEAADPEFGGSAEAVDFNGQPLFDMPRRLRVQARQTYSFAHAYLMGWKPGLEAMRKPLEFMLKHYRHENGGWICKVARDGSPIDQGVESYEQAFVILALGWAAKATGDTELLKLGEDTIHFLFENMRHPKGGFVENMTGADYRRANPHMHLLETSMHWANLHQNERMFELSREIYGLYRTRFCVNGLLREYFDDELRLPEMVASPELLYLEPGHLIEWAYLLRRYGDLHNMKDGTVATLAGFAEQYGVHEATGFFSDQVTIHGEIPQGTASRMWPQTEAIRLWQDHGGAANKAKALALLARMKDSYLTFDGQTPGYWADVVQPDGAVSGDKAPASTLYHMLGALEPLVAR